MVLHDIQQNSEEWLMLRIGKFTASCCDKLLSDPKTKGYKELIEKIAEERFTGEKCQSKVWIGNSFTEMGHILEPVAIKQYEDESFETVGRIGFVEKNSWVGCSPDGLIGNRRLIQVKCPIFRTQLEYLSKMKVPGNYYKQMQFELYVTERKVNIFYSYHKNLNPVEILLPRDEDLIEKIEQRLDTAKKEVNSLIEKYGNLRQ